MKDKEKQVVLSREEYESDLTLQYDTGYEFGRKETAKKIIKRLKQIIEKALKSNYNAIEKREEKHPYLLEDELFEVRCKGKIDALTGINYELDELSKQFDVEIKERLM